MHAVLTNFGTTGDTLPFVTLAVELRRRGHRAVLALPPAFAGLAAAQSLPFVPVGPDLRREQDEVNRAMAETPDVVGSPEHLASLLRPLALALPQMTDDLLAACAGADVLVGGRTQAAARIVHDRTHLPFASVLIEHAASGGHPAFQEAVRRVVNPARARAQLPPLQNPLVDGLSDALVLHAMSRHVRPAAALPPRHHVVGYFFLEHGPFEPEGALHDFLSAAAPPIVFTFGSMAHRDPAALARLFVEAARRAGRRALIQAGPATSFEPPPWARLAGALPHGWLFARAACVVHHGGAGTTASALRAGVPQVVVPHAYDQLTWGQIVHDRGCGPAPIAYPELTAERLSDAVGEALASTATRVRAEALGALVRGEQGAGRACQLIEEFVGRVGLVDERPGQHGDAAGPPEAAADGAARRRLFERRRARERDD